MAGYDDENIANTVQTFREIGVCNKIRRELDAGQIADVFTVRHHCLKQVELDNSAKPDVAPGTRELQRQGGSPGTSADNCDRIGSCVAY